MMYEEYYVRVKCLQLGRQVGAQTGARQKIDPSNTL